MEAAKFGGKVTYIENYAAVRRNTVFGKKEGSKKLTRKQKDSLIEKHGGKKTAARQFSEDDEADE